MEMETTPNNKENINTETVQHTEALSEAELNEKKRIEFEALLEVQKTKRENIKQEKQINAEQNKDPKEMMLNIQKTFKEKYDALNKEVEESKEGVNIDKLFESFGELKAYFIDTSYSLTPYDRRLYSEQLDKLETSLHQLKEKTQPRKKFAFSKKIEKKTDVVKETTPVAAQQETEQKDSLSMIKGVENKTGESLTLNQSDLEHNFKLQNLENCQINLNGRMKTLYLKNLKGCTINIGVVEGPCFIDGLIDCNLQLVAHQVRIHNSKNTTFKLFATSKPIIEHCTEVKFGQYDYKYEAYEQDLIDAKLQGKENLWNQIQDFNWHKQEKSPNFELL